MTRIHLFLTLSLVICATAPCADGLAAAPQLGPVLPDTWWHDLADMRAFLAASMDGNAARIAAGVLAALLAWRYRSLPRATSTAEVGRRHKASLRTIVGGLPASGVVTGAPPLPRPPLATPARPSAPTRGHVSRGGV